MSWRKTGKYWKIRLYSEIYSLTLALRRFSIFEVGLIFWLIDLFYNLGEQLDKCQVDGGDRQIQEVDLLIL